MIPNVQELIANANPPLRREIRLEGLYMIDSTGKRRPLSLPRRLVPFIRRWRRAEGGTAPGAAWKWLQYRIILWRAQRILSEPLEGPFSERPYTWLETRRMNREWDNWKEVSTSQAETEVLNA